MPTLRLPTVTRRPLWLQTVLLVLLLVTAQIAVASHDHLHKHTLVDCGLFLQASSNAHGLPVTTSLFLPSPTPAPLPRSSVGERPPSPPVSTARARAPPLTS